MSHSYSAQVNPDPHNDQMAARANQELEGHIRSTRRTMEQAASKGGGRVEVMALIASAFIDSKKLMPRETLASVLAAALIRLAEGEAGPTAGAVVVSTMCRACGDNQQMAQPGTKNLFEAHTNRQTGESCPGEPQ